MSAARVVRPDCPPWCTSDHEGDPAPDATHHFGFGVELAAVGAVDHDTYDALVEAGFWSDGEFSEPLVSIPDFGADLSIDGARAVSAALLAAAEWLETVQ